MTTMTTDAGGLVCAYCRAVSAGKPTGGLVCECGEPCEIGEAGGCAATTAVAAGARADYPRAAGRVDSGPGEAYVHLVFLLPGPAQVWVTACPADMGDGLWARSVRPELALVDCPVCLAGAGGLVSAVNRDVAERQWAEATSRELLAGFIDWAAAEYPDGGAVLAVYDGGTRLYAMRPDERARAVELWLESRRVYPVVE